MTPEEEAWDKYWRFIGRYSSPTLAVSGVMESIMHAMSEWNPRTAPSEEAILEEYKRLTGTPDD